MFGHKPRKVDAVEIITEADGTVKEADIKKCCHCGCYWKKKPGSGRLRGFCFKCMDEFCGPGCEACTPHEKWLQDESKRQQEFHRIENERWLENIYNKIARRS